MRDSKWWGEHDTLMELLQEEGRGVEEDVFYENGYDSPMKFWNRRNEVWLVKKQATDV